MTDDEEFVRWEEDFWRDKKRYPLQREVWKAAQSLERARAEELLRALNIIARHDDSGWTPEHRQCVKIAREALAKYRSGE